MRSMQPQRAVLWLGVLVAAVSLATAALPMSEETSPNASLAGQLLVASPEMGDPRFRHAVILMVRHDKTGALGIVINHPLGEQTWASVLEAIGEPTDGIAGSVQVFAGGPVQPFLGFIVHSAEYHRAETIDIDGQVAMTASIEILRDLSHAKGPHKSLVAFGYTGWGPGQLEGEMARHGWFAIPEDPKLVFDDDRDKVWDEAKARQTFPL
jgi:putative transcriptional regulator